MTGHSDLPPQIKTLRSEIAGMLQSVEPSTSESGLTLYPCEVTTDDGGVHPRVFLAEATGYLREWGVWPWADKGKGWIPTERIVSLRSSPQRLAAKFANTLNAAGETGMGYCAFSVELIGGTRHFFVTGNAVDFPRWPVGISPDEVLSVHPHERASHRHGRPDEVEHPGAEYFWSLYRKASDRDPIS